MHFVAVDRSPEDAVTANYLRDTAIQAGLATAYLDVAQVGWDDPSRRFVDPSLRPIRHAFKLYPWEWMMDEAFGPHLPVAPTRWWEPPWKVLLSNKAILAVLWDLYPNHPNLVPASLTEMTDDGGDGGDGGVVRKPAAEPGGEQRDDHPRRRLCGTRRPAITRGRTSGSSTSPCGRSTGSPRSSGRGWSTGTRPASASARTRRRSPET